MKMRIKIKIEIKIELEIKIQWDTYENKDGNKEYKYKIQ